MADRIDLQQELADMAEELALAQRLPPPDKPCELWTHDELEAVMTRWGIDERRGLAPSWFEVVEEMEREEAECRHKVVRAER